ncbi:esterase [Roseococcus sp.]|uniref:esterase n=1 Tax=Roseococcus sp. TaxID=2109646 RepID=UPI003BAB3212
MPSKPPGLASRRGAMLGTGLLATTLPAAAQTPNTAAPAPLQVASIGSFHVGGGVRTLTGLPAREVRMTATGPLRRIEVNGDYMVGQMYVQYVKLAAPKARHPLMLWHGGGLSGACWEDTPDGRPGWQSFFLRAGHDVYVSDAFERGRASWPRFPEILPDEPVFRSLSEAWRTFRFGPPNGFDLDPAKRRPYPGARFPVAALENLGRGAIPRWASSDAFVQSAYGAYLARMTEPSVIVVHSQGVAFALRAALDAPGKVAAVVAVEGSGAPDPATVDMARMRNIPLLMVWGDYLDQAPWPAYRGAVDRFAAALTAAGGSAELMELPARGIAGNTHMLMHDDNSDQVAGLIQGWLAAKGLMKA